MRVRTEAKRREIIEIAGQLFEELGYERTSMSLISERVGGSKATLYGYFASKEELLLAVLDAYVVEQSGLLLGEAVAIGDLREALIALGQGFVKVRLASRSVATFRIFASQPEESGLGKIFYEKTVRPAQQRLAAWFERKMEEGVLRRADPWIATMHWKGLCEWDLFERRLTGAISEADPEEVRQAATLAADAFLKIYAPEE